MKIKNIAVLSGEKTTVKNGVITYKPNFEDVFDLDNKKSFKRPIPSELRTNYLFNQGIIKFKFKADTHDTGVLITHDTDKNHIFSAGHSYYDKQFRIYNTQTKKKVTGGSLINFPTNEEINIRFELYGSESKLFVNDILYCENKLQPSTFPLSFRVVSTGEVVVYDIEVNETKPKLFVVMQFTEEYNNLYKEVIIPIAHSKGLEVIRADEFYSSTPILSDIIRSIEESSIIIAEITPDNPNVFYEIGYAHAIKKPTILICDRKRDKLPFDISSFRTLFYDNTISGKSKIEKSLEKYLDTILENGM